MDVSWEDAASQGPAWLWKWGYTLLLWLLPFVMGKGELQIPQLGFEAAAPLSPSSEGALFVLEVGTS